MHSRSVCLALVSLMAMSAQALPMKGSTSRLARRAHLADRHLQQRQAEAGKTHTIHIEGGVSGSTINVNLGARQDKSIGDHSVLVDASAAAASSSALATSSTGGGIHNSTINLTVIDARKKRSTIRSLIENWFGKRSSSASPVIIIASATASGDAVDRRTKTLASSASAATGGVVNRRTKTLPRVAATFHAQAATAVAAVVTPATVVNRRTKTLPVATGSAATVADATGTFSYKVVPTVAAAVVARAAAADDATDSADVSAIVRNRRTKTLPQPLAPTAVSSASSASSYTVRPGFTAIADSTSPGSYKIVPDSSSSSAVGVQAAAQEVQPLSKRTVEATMLMAVIGAAASPSGTAPPTVATTAAHYAKRQRFAKARRSTRIP